MRGQLSDADDVCAAATIDGSDPTEEACVLSWRAVIRWTKGDLDGCASFVEPALDAARVSANDTALAMAHTANAMLAALRGDLHTNLHAYQRALEHAQRAGDVVQIVRIHANRGSRFNEEGRYAEALAEL